MSIKLLYYLKGVYINSVRKCLRNNKIILSTKKCIHLGGTQGYNYVTKKFKLVKYSDACSILIISKSPQTTNIYKYKYFFLPHQHYVKKTLKKTPRENA